MVLTRKITLRLAVVFALVNFLAFPCLTLANNEDRSLQQSEYGLKNTFTANPSVNEAIGGNTNLAQVIGRVVGAGLAFLGVLFMLLIIYGGILWMIARGNDQEVKKAKDILTGAVIGLVIVLAAYAITVFVSSSLSLGATPPATE